MTRATLRRPLYAAVAVLLGSVALLALAVTVIVNLALEACARASYDVFRFVFSIIHRLYWGKEVQHANKRDT